MARGRVAQSVLVDRGESLAGMLITRKPAMRRMDCAILIHDHGLAFSNWRERQGDFRQLIPIRPLGEPNSARISAACPVRLAAHFHLIAGFAQTGMMKIGAGVDH